ncbi:hypothetical protein AAFF_G00378210 [Aldrovandia affinis]|nr:hypothetical protein AAFF_G00378210 [Aldrovandia affinis]
MRRELAEVRNELRRELSAVGVELQHGDNIIQGLREQLEPHTATNIPHIDSPLSTLSQHLAYNHDILPDLTYDHMHLNKQGVKGFAKILKDTAF